MAKKITVLFLIVLIVIAFWGVQTFLSRWDQLLLIRREDLIRQQRLLYGKELEMKILSSAFDNGEKISSEYTCDGANVNPRLEISQVTSGAKSLVLIVDDPDAPSGLWNHWLVWNISPETRAIGPVSVPDGAIEGTNDFEEIGYNGPCPPSGEHRYMFRLYSLDTELNLASGANREELDAAMEGHVIGKAGIMGRYSRH